MRHRPRSGVPSRRRVVATSLAVVLLAGVAACGNAGSGPSSAPVPPADTSAGEQDGAVTIRTFAFDPDPVRVRAGTIVTWTNEDKILHTVSSGRRDDADGVFHMKLDGPGSVAERTFATPGTFAYHCSIHPGMEGVVEVR